MAELKAYKHETGRCIGTILVGELKQYFHGKHASDAPEVWYGTLKRERNFHPQLLRTEDGGSPQALL